MWPVICGKKRNKVVFLLWPPGGDFSPNRDGRGTLVAIGIIEPSCFSQGSPGFFFRGQDTPPTNGRNFGGGGRGHGLAEKKDWGGASRSSMGLFGFRIFSGPAI